MPLSASRIACLLALVVASACTSERSRKTAWYDVADVSQGLRPGVAVEAHRRLGLGAPNDVARYDMSLRLADDLRTFELDETVWFTNTSNEALTDVAFRIYANARKPKGAEMPLSFRAGDCGETACEVSWDDHSVLVIRLKSALARRGRVKVNFKFAGRLDEIASARTGLVGQAFEGAGRIFGGPKAGQAGQGDYGIMSFADGIASLGDFYAVMAPREGGAWLISESSAMGDLNAGAQVSHITLDVVARKDVRIASSGVVVSESADGAVDAKPADGTVGVKSADGAVGRVRTRVVAPFVRNVAVLASRNFEVATAQAGSVTVRSWFSKAHRSTGERVLDGARHAFETFETRFGPYPYTELDVVEAPLVGGAGGVEFSGLVTVATMFYRPLRGGVVGMMGNAIEEAVRPMTEFVTAHEVAHQWWHGLVGSDARGAPFVDEALAQHSAVLYFEDRYGKARAKTEQTRQVVSNYHFMRLQGKPDAAVDQAVDQFGDEVRYAGIVYGKAPMMFQAFRDRLGEPRYTRALQTYVRNHRFGVASKDALIDALVGKSEDEAALRSLAHRWLKERHGDDDLGAARPDDIFRQWAPNHLDKQLEGVEALLEGLGGALDGLLVPPGAP